jgi:hypothetical protein
MLDDLSDMHCGKGLKVVYIIFYSLFSLYVELGEVWSVEPTLMF